MQKTIKLPYKCILPLVRNKNLLRAFCVYGKLKLKFSYGSIHNIKSRKNELSKILGISENTFRKYLQILKDNGFIDYHNDNTLRLLNKYSIYEALGVCPTYRKNSIIISQKVFELSYDELTETNIKLLAISLKMNQVDYKNTDRITNVLMEKVGEIKSEGIKKKVQAFYKSRAMSILTSLKENPANSFHNNNKWGFVDNNLSTDKLANMFGYKSKSTPNRFLHKLKNLGLVEYNRREMFIQKIDVYTNLSNFNNMTYVLRKHNNYYLLYQVITNELIIK